MGDCPKKFLYAGEMFPNPIFVIELSPGKSFGYPCSFPPEKINDKLFRAKVSQFIMLEGQSIPDDSLQNSVQTEKYTNSSLGPKKY